MEPILPNTAELLRNARCVLVERTLASWRAPWASGRPRHPQYTTPRASVNGQVCAPAGARPMRTPRMVARAWRPGIEYRRRRQKRPQCESGERQR